MTDDEEQSDEIRRIVREVLAEERKLRDDDEFYIKRKELYDTHQRTLGIFRMFDKTAEVIGKTVLYCIIGGIVTLIAIGAGKVKLW